MNLVGKAIWYIESHFGGDVTLDDVATVAGVSRFHMARAFGLATGNSVMRYVRGRRLSEAARALVQGSPDILTVALEAGYGSHEAFTRAFRAEFGLTPEALRARAHLDALDLMEPIRMDETQLGTLPPPRFETRKEFFVAGLSARYTNETSTGIPAQWQRFVPHIGHIPRQTGSATYGVCYNSDADGNIDYMSGVEVSGLSELPPELTGLRIPAQRYAVFAHDAHISQIRRTWASIFARWLPASGHHLGEGPSFERYGPTFDAETGQGGFEIWIPLKA
jgi:AraC family transcriptional regulator